MLCHESSMLNPEYVLANICRVTSSTHNCIFFPPVWVPASQLFFACTFHMIIRNNKSLTMPLSIFLAKKISFRARYLATPAISNQNSYMLVRRSPFVGLGVLKNLMVGGGKFFVRASLS